MGVLSLPRIPQFRHRPLLALRNEDRVVAEALASGRRLRDPSLERARAAKLASVRGEEDELRDVAGAAILDALELAEELRDSRRSFRRVTRGEDAGPAAEGLHLEARVLRQHPAV